MYLYGSFLTQLGETVTVHIVTGNSRVRQLEIGDGNSGVYFTVNPVEIESCVNDTFDHLLRSQATIRLLTRDFIPDLFCTSCMEAVVNIFKGDRCVFAGFIQNAVICLVLGAALTIGVLLAIRMLAERKSGR